MKELIINSRPKCAVSESIKSIRTNLQFLEVDEKVKSILVTSSKPSEGKSFISANLAVAFSQIGKKVLIVDADMRLGRQSKIFKVDNEKGLSNLLLLNVDKEFKKFIKKTEIDNVYILPNGIVPPNPSELLTSDKNKKLAGILEKNYDLVIYDGTPVSGIPDSLILSDIVDKIIVVSAYKVTKSDELENTEKALSKFKNKIAGVILNKVPQKKSNYYYYGEHNKKGK